MVSPWGHSISFSLDPESGQEPRDTLDPGSTSSGGRSPQEPEPVPDDVARWLTIGDTNRNLVAVKLFPGTMGIKSSPDSSFRGSDSPGSSSMVVEVGESNPPPMAPVTESFGELHTTDQHHFGHQSSHVVALSAIAPLDPAYDPGLLDLIRQTNSRISDAGGTISYQPEHNEAVGLEMADNTLRNGGMTSPVIDIPSRPTPSQQSTTGVPPRPRTRKRGVPRSPDTRRRRRQSNRNSNFRNSSLNDGAGRAKSFICSFRHYGCDSTFGNKNEWKRHINTQHIKQAFWRCNQGSCDVSRQQPRVPNDFNRKDLFMQHLRRMHAPWGRARLPSPHERDQFERHIILVTNQCHVHLRNPPPRSRCGFCSSTFTNWETRLEHVGRHYEQQQQASRTSSGSDTSGEGQEEVEDPDLRDWALREGVIRWDSATQRLVMC